LSSDVPSHIRRLLFERDNSDTRRSCRLSYNKGGEKHYIHRICIGLPCFVQRVKMVEGIETTEELAASFFMTEGRKRSVGELQLSRTETDSEEIYRFFNGCKRLTSKTKLLVKTLTDPQQIE